MERGWKMDLARSASNRSSLIPTIILTFLLFGNAVSMRAADDQLTHRAKQLFADRRWQEIAGLGKSAQNPSADFDFYYGTALAQLGRLAEAQNAFAAGARLQPQDKRFPLEQAGVSFKAKNYSQSARHLRRALRIDPHDSYGNNFLGTVYFLQGNIDAALKYWNRVDKPRIAEVQTAPVPQVKPALLDRAFVFAPASVLRLSDLLTTDIRVRNLGIFPSYQFDLRARDDGEYDILFRNGERDGWGSTKLEKLFLLLRGLPQLTVTPEIYNLRHEAINFISMYRWDAEKRRVSAELSAPFKGNPKFRYGLLADLRGENWNIRESFTGPAPLLGSFNMRRESVAASFSSFESGRWRWTAGAEVSHRDFRNVVPGVALLPASWPRAINSSNQRNWMSRCGVRRKEDLGLKVVFPLRQGACGRSLLNPSRSCKDSLASTGFPSLRGTTTKCSRGSVRARHLDLLLSTNCSY